ncbi:hypothetical protein Mal4_44540 [Maioricimonas rarisocia]|uniref:SGNH hydrolase-type esterase domain-containing protein n=1 Tax=Maioricimonas rarisocia TaxID=2528026 RepID=A0A517ZCD5_9PLAN|nr:SGNH/GDSL hydrolase family protein [Maioricimonas rarisocia]QDU40100.1 hypothetical protein Mal4_44540 [Maioricimonas rarisocia]
MPGRSHTPSLLLLAVMAGLHAHALHASEPAPAASPGDRICIVGNTFADRLRVDGYLETWLTTRRPDLQLTVRNLGWSGDTVDIRPRPLNFGSLDEHLTRQRADLVLCCFGMSEALDESLDVADFRQSLLQFVRHLQTQSYNGDAPPQIVLVAPIALETADPRIEDANRRAERLQTITRAIEEVADESSTRFVDLHTLTTQLMQESPSQRLTDNGIHPNEYGYWATTATIADVLVGSAPSWSIEVDAATQSVTHPAADDDAPLQVKLQPANTIGEAALRLRVSTSLLPPPAAPAESLVHPSLSQLLPALTVQGLPDGRYRLTIDDTPVAEADAAQWTAGVTLERLPASRRTEGLRETIRQKNEWFFHRYRPANSEYVFGRRTKPFGSVSFPPEMKQFDQLIERSDGTIHGQARRKRAETWSLHRID